MPPGVAAQIGIVGPVLPHEVVGFSGGNKYLFPGVSGPELIDISHWLGALITSAEIIGTRRITPVRSLIDEAASLVPGRRLALCVVTRSESRFAEPQQMAVRTPTTVSQVARWSRSSLTAGRSYLRPHIREISTMHPLIAEIGYHCRDYILKRSGR